MFRLAVLLHRYLGIAIGCVVALWCLSAFVMMYVQYPEFSDRERVAGLEPLDLAACCTLPAGEARPSASSVLAELPWIDAFRLEMLAGRPVLRSYFGPEEQLVDLRRGAVLQAVTAAEAAAVSRDFARRMRIEGGFAELGRIDRDQWTLAGELEPDRPLFEFRARDAAGTEWYVSSRSGEVVQVTTARGRFWNRLGSVPHWLYFTTLRRHGPAWAATVIWLSLLALFLTTLGLYIGITQLRVGRGDRLRRPGRLSPYRGWHLWHHYAGLIFGVLTLTWLLSGFLSMNPWGALEGRSFGPERANLRGGDVAPDRVADIVRRLSKRNLPQGTVRLDSSLVDGRLTLVATRADGRRTRLDADTLAPRPLEAGFFARAAELLRPGEPVAAQGWLREGDEYYFSHHDAAVFPVYRIRYADRERFYLDAVTGELSFAVDAARRGYRWWFEALHRGDFARLLRSRPAWDLFMLPLLLGVACGAVTGTWLGLRRWLRPVLATIAGKRAAGPRTRAPGDDG